jgi:hypothetical protein
MRAMKNLVRAWSGRTEFIVTVLGAFGIFLYGNIVSLLPSTQSLPQNDQKRQRRIVDVRRLSRLFYTAQ